MPLRARTREMRKPISIPPRIPAGLPEAMVAGGIFHGRILFGLPGLALALGALGANGGFPAAVRRTEGNDLRSFVDICAHDCPLMVSFLVLQNTGDRQRERRRWLASPAMRSRRRRNGGLRR